MERAALRQLVEWKEKSDRKPLIVQGARQVGKTWLMTEFGKRYFKKTANFVFEKNEPLQNLFSADLNVERILDGLSILAGFKITPNDTLIVFDEIQECPNALTSLKYFCENAPQYAVIAAGSMLGVALHSGVSFPVGKVEFMTLHPMSFYEFLSALGEDMKIEALKKNAFDLLSPFHSAFLDLLKRYFYVGGMPEAVASFVADKDYGKVRAIQKNILMAYVNDFSKHIPKAGIPKLRLLWESIPGQLAKENKKFTYGNIQQGARAKEFENALAWLQSCGLIHKLFRVQKPDLPLMAYQDLSAFKVYVSDIGLLCAMTDLDAKVLLDENTLFEEFKGALAEQYVLQELKTLTEKPTAYWTNDRGTAEVDFLMQNEMSIVPIEVKAGINLRAKSLKTYMEKYAPAKAVRVSAANFKQTENLTDLPLYAVAEIFNYI